MIVALAILLASIATADAAGVPSGRFVVRSAKAVGMLDGRTLLDLAPSSDRTDGTSIALAFGEFSRAAGIEPPGTVYWTAVARGGTTWRLRGRSSAPRLRIRLKPARDGERLRGRLSGRGIGNVRFVAAPSTCGDGFLDRGAGEECDGAVFTCGFLTCSACTCRKPIGPGESVTIPSPHPGSTLLDIFADTTRIVGLAGPTLTLFQLKLDGQPFDGFGTNGFVDVGLSTSEGRPASLDFGSLVVTPRMLRRYLYPGSLDPAFGDEGSLALDADAIVSPFPSPDAGIFLVIGDGLARLSQNGKPETTIVPMVPQPNVGQPFAGSNGLPYRFTGVGAFDPDGRFLAVHEFAPPGPTVPRRTVQCLTRFLSDGSVDPVFAGGFPFDGAANCVPASSDDPADRIVGAAVPFVTPIGLPIVNTSVVDSSGAQWETRVLGDDGSVVATPFTCRSESVLDTCRVPRTLAAMSDGTMAQLVDALAFDGGHVAAPTSTFVQRLLPDGTLDPAFGDGGAVELPDAQAVALIRHDVIVGSGDGTSFTFTRLR